MPTTGKLSGTLVGVYSGSTLIGNSTSANLSYTVNTRETTTKDSSSSVTRLATTDDWSISGDFIIALDAAYGFSELFTAAKAKTPITVKFSTEVTGDKYWTGSGIITQCDFDAPMEDNCTGSYTIEAAGALTEATVA